MNGNFVNGLIEQNEIRNASKDKNVPITFENFGLMALGQMGWKEGKVIGRNPVSYSSTIYEIKPRMQGLGLGAIGHPEPTKEEDKKVTEASASEIKLNTVIYIIEGIHKGMSGILKAFRGDADCIVEVNNENISISRSFITSFIPKENGKDNISEQKQIIASKPEKDKKLKAFKWVRPSLVVRIVSKKYQNGKYYLKKGVVIDLLLDSVVVMLENNDLLENLRERDIETTIPPIGELVLIVKGGNIELTGSVIRKEKNGKIWVKEQLGSDILEITADMCCAFSDQS
jgi:G patch domain/KOW motif-containing protein